MQEMNRQVGADAR